MQVDLDAFRRRGVGLFAVGTPECTGSCSGPLSQHGTCARIQIIFCTIGWQKIQDVIRLYIWGQKVFHLATAGFSTCSYLPMRGWVEAFVISQQNHDWKPMQKHQFWCLGHSTWKCLLNGSTEDLGGAAKSKALVFGKWLFTLGDLWPYPVCCYESVSHWRLPLLLTLAFFIEQTYAGDTQGNKERGE